MSDSIKFSKREKLDCGLFGLIFLVFAIKGLVTGDMCGIGKLCNPITFDVSPVEFVISQGACWGLAVFLLSRIFKQES